MTNNQTTSQDPLGDRVLALIARFWPAGSIAERTRRRVTLHLIPYLFFLYILAYLDRVNVSVAALTMKDPSSRGGLGFGSDIIGFGFGIFFWGYWILEMPSTMSVVRWGARWVFVRILILWGLCVVLIGAIDTPLVSSIFSWLPQISEHTPVIDSFDGRINRVFGWLAHQFRYRDELQLVAGFAHFLNHLHDTPAYQFYFLRFMLGFFEGGFFPSVIVYLSHWFRTEDRAKAIASFMAAIPISSVFGNPLSGMLLDVHWFGLQGWRWIFILEGIAPILAGFLTLFFLPNRPKNAKWLSADERDWLEGELEREQLAKKGHGHWAWVHHIGIVLLLTGVYFCLNLTSYGLSSFMPAIIKSQSGVSNEWASVLAALPYVMGLTGMLVNGRHSDRRKERIWHVAVPLSMLSLCIGLTALFDGVSLLPVFILIFLVGTFMYAHLPAFWPIPTMFLGSVAAASAIGFINMLGNLGGSVGPTVVGNVATNPISPALGVSSVGLLGSPLGQGPLLAPPTLIAGNPPTSFAKALWILAPWPLFSAAIIVIAGYTRQRVSAKKST